MVSSNGGLLRGRCVSPTILLAAVCLLLFFEKLTIPPVLQKMIRHLSPMSFGVYLIHNHPLIFTHCLKGRFAGCSALPWPVEVLSVLGIAVCINLICCIIDFARLELFKRLHIRQALDNFEERIRASVIGSGRRL